jgi:hypothetical protein
MSATIPIRYTEDISTAAVRNDSSVLRYPRRIGAGAARYWTVC